MHSPVVKPDHPATAAPAQVGPADPTGHDHFVQFYDDDSFLVSSVATFVGAGLIAGNAAVVIATESHRAAIDAELQTRGLDPSSARAAGRYIPLDAAHTLDQFMLDGSPDPARFNQVIGGVLARAGNNRRRPIRAYGEMVALLWADGNRAAAIRLEELWNAIAAHHSFSLCCGYPMTAFPHQSDADEFARVCDCHSRVVPAEDYASLATRDDRLRAITALQQKARSLEAEIAQRKQVEHALRTRERELADFFETASEGLHKVGPDGTILWANRAELELLGYSPDEYIGRHIAEFHADRHVIDDMLARLLRGESLYNQPARLRHKDGSIKHVLVHSNPCFDGDRFVCTRCFTRDITDRFIAEQELRHARDAAELAGRAKDQFLAVLSHELRTPLTPVLMSVASMETEPGLAPRLRDDLAMIRRNISLETRLIDDLLDVSRVVNGKMALHRQDTDVHLLIKNVVEMVAADAHAKSITLRTDLAAPRSRVHADSARLHQVLWNLLHNAIKFTPAGGAVTIRTETDPNSRLAIAVHDTGIGIDPAIIQSIFNAFEQGARAVTHAYGGLGLGLAISKAVIDLHGGSIQAHSPGKNLGATFTLALPTTSSAPGIVPASSRPESATGNPQPAPLHILLVDDHADTLKVLRRLLESDGHTVTPASSVADALHAADAANQPALNLLLSDIGLPDGTGHQLLRQLRTRHPRLRAIAMTGFGMDQDIRSSLDAGFATHLTKPVDIASLRQTIRRVTADSRPH